MCLIEIPKLAHYPQAAVELNRAVGKRGMREKTCHFIGSSLGGFLIYLYGAKNFGGKAVVINPAVKAL